MVGPVGRAAGLPPDFVDMVVMNYYHGAGAALGAGAVRLGVS